VILDFGCRLEAILDMPSADDFRISFDSLFTYHGQAHIELTSPPSWNHIHGRLIVRICGRNLPHMGYFGEGDVCLGTWLQVLSDAKDTLAQRETAEYIFDEGEQGQPAFVFRREGQLVSISIVASEISDGPGDDDWQDVSVSYLAFAHEIERVKSEFVQHLRSTHSYKCEKWLDNQLWWSPNPKSQI
jgi:hypothetical protein